MVVVGDARILVHDANWLELLHLVKEKKACSGSPMPDLPPLPSRKDGATGKKAINHQAGRQVSPPLASLSVSSWMLPDDAQGALNDNEGDSLFADFAMLCLGPSDGLMTAGGIKHAAAIGLGNGYSDISVVEGGSVRRHDA